MCTTIIEEEWRDIAGYEGLYQVSNLGRVKSLNYKRSGKEQCLVPCNTGYGYLRVDLYKNENHNRFYIHRLVAEAFIPNSNNLTEVNHKDENHKNNRLDNLEWISHKDNVNYGTRSERILEHRNGPKKTKQIICIETWKIYPSAHEAARRTGNDDSSIIKCCRGKQQTTGGFHWRYAD